MTDPRDTDPRYQDSHFSDPISRRDPRVDNVWGWIAGLAVVVLVAFILVAGWHGSKNTASNTPPATTGTASRSMPPSTTGMGSPTPMKPAMPAPTTPAPSDK